MSAVTIGLSSLRNPSRALISYQGGDSDAVREYKFTSYKKQMATSDILNRCQDQPSDEPYQPKKTVLAQKDTDSESDSEPPKRKRSRELISIGNVYAAEGATAVIKRCETPVAPMLA
eukprot:scpid94253/ scgid23500/ 